MANEKHILIKSCILLAVALIILVPVADMVVSLFIKNTSSNADTFTTQQMLAGIISETARAFITCYLYAASKDKGSTLAHGIKHGLLYSALIASLYIVLGGFYFRPKDPTLFVVSDSLILLVQGIATGFVLYYTHRQKAGTES